jgi:signal peptide peptidase SppA
MPSNLLRVIAAVRSQVWAMRPDALRQMAEVLAHRARHGHLPQAEIDQRLAAVREAAAGRPRANDPGNIAVIPIHGTILNRAGMMDEVSGMVGAESIAQQLRKAEADPDIKAIVLDIDSPGGMVAGLPELAAEIAATKKYVLAVANQMAASAAYWLASQADDVVVAPSGEVGSIGVVTIHQDLSAAFEAEGVKNTVLVTADHKYEGNPYEPLSDEAKAAIMADLKAFDDMFVRDVAKGRGVSTAKVRADFGQGRTLLAKAAVAAGMADRVGTLRDEVRKLGGVPVPVKRGARSEAPAPLAQEETTPAPLPDTSKAKAKLDWLRAGGQE